MAAVMTASNDHHRAESSRRTPYTLVAGLGASGLAAARYLAGAGEAVIVIDSRARPPGLAELERDCPGVEVELETLAPEWLDHASRLVLSPGLAITTPIVTEARRRGIEVLGELELFARAAAAPVIAVTGSNGKSTVTSLVSHLLSAQGIRAPAGGNLGPAALELLELGEVDAYVLEVSSFQLETTVSLKPHAAALLNISPDHIDRHGSLEHYAALKASLLTHAVRAVVNWDDELVRELAPRARMTVPFSVREPLSTGWSIVDSGGEAWIARGLKPLIPAASLALSGTTGKANTLAALALADSLGLDVAIASRALGTFEGLPHRMREVSVVDGVRYVDDSKGTNVGAAAAAIESVGGPVVLIAGGRSKGAGFAPLARAARGRVRMAILIGEAAGELEQAFAGSVPTIRAADMPTAVAEAARLATSGDTVLLSPACASQDMFVDYRDRGERFAAAVRSLAR